MKIKLILSYILITVLFFQLVSPRLVNSDQIELSEPRLHSKTSVEEALQCRRSRRQFKDKPLNIEEISQILWAAYGITKPIPHAPEFLRGGLKTAPSAGARYPLEIYILADKVQGLQDGIYKYNTIKHNLRLIKQGKYLNELVVAAYKQSWIKQAAAVVIYTAVFQRTTERYGKRGRKRYVCMDLGHSAQNVYLQCESLHLATCAVGAFNDVEIQTLLDISEKETPLYIMPIGKQK